MEFHETVRFRIFRKFIDKVQISLQSDKNNGHLHDLAELFFERNMFQTNVVDKLKILCSIIFFKKIVIEPDRSQMAI
jgi:intein-encoded DNA endonuclease-like protein